MNTNETQLINSMPPILYTFVHPQIPAYQIAYYMRDTTVPE